MSMYQKGTTADSLAVNKVKHRDQLAQLLISKFRNRFGVTAEDSRIASEIQKEVTSLLAKGAATEQGLMKLEAKIETVIQKIREDAQLAEEETKLRQGFKQPNTAPAADALSQRSHHSQRSRTSERSIHSLAGRSVAASSQRGAAIPGVRSKFAVVHLDPAAKLNMTDEEWVKRIQLLQAEEAAQEREKQDRQRKMLKEIQNEQLQQMQNKKELEKKMKNDDRQFFNEVGVKSSDCYYMNDDKVERQKKSLRGVAREVANKLNEDHQKAVDHNKKRMIDQAKKRLEDLEKMKQDEEDGRAQKQEAKMRLLGIQKED